MVEIIYCPGGKESKQDSGELHPSSIELRFPNGPDQIKGYVPL